MSENETNETENGTGAEAEAETPVETPEPQAEPAGEPEAVEAKPAAEEPPTTAEPEAAATEDEPTPAESEKAPAGEAAAEPAPGPAATKRSRRHVPRSERRQRPRKVRAGEDGTRKPIVRLEKPDHERGRRQERRGVVVSDAMDKTIVVRVESVKAHARYKKVVRRSVKFHAHDPENQAHVGDLVRIVETRPVSKTKYWRLAEVLEAAK
jgi:small subunit ribosomal protein S17